MTEHDNEQMSKGETKKERNWLPWIIFLGPFIALTIAKIIVGD